ncbi:MAG TPA: hypothetical protein VI146_08085 [Nitrososphaeraceae archaeon]
MTEKNFSIPLRNNSKMPFENFASIILIFGVFWMFIGWHIVYGDYAACFNLERDYKQFLNGSNAGYIASIPCPANGTLLEQPIQKDESGK